MYIGDPNDPGLWWAAVHAAGEKRKRRSSGFVE